MQEPKRGGSDQNNSIRSGGSFESLEPRGHLQRRWLYSAKEYFRHANSSARWPKAVSCSNAAQLTPQVSTATSHIAFCQSAFASESGGGCTEPWINRPRRLRR